MIACDSYLSLFFFTLQKKLRSGAIVRFSDNSSFDFTCIGGGSQSHFLSLGNQSMYEG